METIIFKNWITPWSPRVLCSTWRSDIFFSVVGKRINANTSKNTRLISNFFSTHRKNTIRGKLSRRVSSNWIRINATFEPGKRRDDPDYRTILYTNTARSIRTHKHVHNRISSRLTGLRYVRNFVIVPRTRTPVGRRCVAVSLFFHLKRKNDK